MNRGPLAAVAIIGMAVMGLAAILYATAQGAGASPDSVSYIRMADQFRVGGKAGSGQFPPLYPAILALLSRLGVTPLVASRWLNALLFGATILLIGGALMYSLPDRPWAALAAAMLVLVAPSMTGIHVMAWSEPLFLFLTYACLWALAVWLETPTPARLLFAILLAALALLTRYIGLALVLAGGLGILWQGRGPLQRRVGYLLLWVALSVLPLAAWLLASESSGTRTLSFHPPGLTSAGDALVTTAGWLQVPDSASDKVRFLLLGLLLVWALIVMVWRAKNARTVEPAPVFLKLVALFVAAYAATLVLSLTFFDANTPLDNRILSPILIAAIVWITYLASETVRLNPVSAAPATWICVLAAVLLCSLSLRHTMGNLGREHREGIGFTSLAWQRSEALRLARAAPPSVTLYSNAPEPVYLLAGRDAQPFPRPRSAMTASANPDYSAEMDAMAAALRTGQGLAIYFRTLPLRTTPSESDLLGYAGIARITETADGALYGAGKSQ